jgi:chromosome segregation ATPase
MGSPIRCLDEFDVFMDSVNRDVTLKMIVDVSKRSVGKQYVLITPQSMGNLTAYDHVKVIKYAISYCH